jgi:CRP-like cAMP-binding protein
MILPSDRWIGPSADPWPADEALSPPCEYPAGFRLGRQGDEVAAAYLVDEGVVTASHSVEGRKPALLGFFGPGALIGMQSAICGWPHPLTFETLTVCQLRYIGVPELRVLVRVNEVVNEWVVVTQARHRYEVQALVALLARATPPRRLRALLVSLIRTGYGRTREGGMCVPPELTLGRIATAVGLSPSQMFALLEKEAAAGLIVADGSRIEVPSGSDLLRIARSDREWLELLVGRPSE